MRIVGVTVVRNEEDIVEATIRSNLGALDALVVVDHGSTDATPEVLASLVAEGLPLEVSRDDSLEYRSSEMTTRLVRAALARGADLCMPLDADEFLLVASRTALEAAAAAADPSRPLSVSETIWIPDFDAPGDIVARLRRGKRFVHQAAAPSKLIVRRAFADLPSGVVDGGHRTLLPQAGASPMPDVALDPAIASIAHVPVRSPEQYTAKVSVGHLSRLLGDADSGGATAGRYRAAFEAIVAGRTPTREGLAAIAASWSLPPGERGAAGTGDWIDDRFPIDLALRYTPSRPSAPLARVLAFGERVAAEVAATTGGL